MSTLTELLTICRTDLLRDTGAVQKWSDAILTRYINQAIRETWPTAFVKVTDSTTEISETAGEADYTNREYSLPSGCPDDALRCGVWRVDMGPLGGQRDSDSLQTTDRYLTLRGLPGNRAWEVDVSRRKLVLNRTPWFQDPGDVRSYFLRIFYIRPIAALSSGTDVLEGPDTLVEFITASVMYQAYRNLMRPQITNRDRLQNLGSLVKLANDDRMDARKRARMGIPALVS